MMTGKLKNVCYRALTISQPYASLIAEGRKWVENRRWHTGYRGTLAIHAGKGTQYLSRRELAEWPTGCVVALAELVACVSFEELRVAPGNVVIGGLSVATIFNHKHTEGPWCLVLRDVRKFRDPIPCSGMQGLWWWNGDQRADVLNEDPALFTKA